MRCTSFIGAVILLVLLPGMLRAQSVLYSPFISGGTAKGFEVIGRAGNFYWVQHNSNSRFTKRTVLKTNIAPFTFEVYDARLNPVKEIPCYISDSIFKEYFVAGDRCFDQLLFTTSGNKTTLVLNRYTEDGNLLSYNQRLHDFPGTMKGNEFLLVRSQDKTKVLLLGFEPVTEAPPRIHAILYNSHWRVLFQTVYKEGQLAQPYIQYDFTNVPLEHFSNSPVQVANNGDWLMVTPSRTSSNYVLYHFRWLDSTGIQSEINQSQGPAVQHTCLSLDNNTGTAIAGMWENAGAPARKKVHVAHYLLAECRVDFDTAYRFTTGMADRRNEKYLLEQDLVPLPGKGFLFLNEYGRTYTSPLLQEDVVDTDADEQEQQVANNNVSRSFKRDDYTRYKGLVGAKREYERGDLSLYYFPAVQTDSCWSGFINKAQTTELNAPNLSYACMPLEGRLVFLYNSLSHTNSRYSSTTIIDNQGAALDEGVVFWKSNNIMDFQNVWQIGMKELAVPYEKNGLQGFAIIKL